MKVARYYNNKDIRLEDIPIPKIGEGEILVRVIASGICGTDAMEWYRVKKGPRILGHEIAGDIAESKSGAYAVGQRVFVSHHVPCLECKYCRAGHQTACDTLHSGNYDPGGYSEFVRVPALNVSRGVFVLPENVSYEEGTMIEPLACVVRGHQLIDIGPRDTVLVLGCGVSGLLNIRMAKTKGAKVIATDINPYRLKKAQACGADQTYHVGEPLPGKADKIIVCAGASQAVEQAFRSIDKKGIILLFAIPQEDIHIPNVEFWRHELTLTSSYGAAPDDLKQALELISSGKIQVGDLITHKLPLERIQEGFHIFSLGKESLKVVLFP